MTDSIDTTHGIWDDLAAAITAGVAHEINNRLVALIGIRHLALEPGPPDPALAETLGHEIHQLAALNGLLSALGERAHEPEPRAADEILATVRALDLRRRGNASPAEWEIEPDLPAVLVRAPALVRGMLILIAGSDDDDSTTAVSARAEHDTLRITIEPPPTEPFRSAAESHLRAAGASLRADQAAFHVLIPAAG